MKKFLFFSLLLSSIVSYAQENEHRFNVSFGGGPQRYNGDLGHGFRHHRPCWYGGMGININYKLNPAFEIGYFGFVGDFGYDQSKESRETEISKNQQCDGCIGRVGMGDLKSRLTNSGLQFRYHPFATNLLHQSIFDPYIYFGSAYNFVSDRMGRNCVREGNYFSLNGGAGASFSIYKNVNLGYNIMFGYFTDDRMDNQVSGMGDMYMQNTLFFSINL